MTSTLATNFVEGDHLGRKYSLAADKNGLPLQGQVPKTLYTYTGVGNVSLDSFPGGGTDTLFINSSLAAGVLNIDLTDDQAYNNMIGRSVRIKLISTAANSVTVDITGGNPARAFLLTGDSGDIATIAAGGVATFTFINSQYCIIDAEALVTTA